MKPDKISEQSIQEPSRHTSVVTKTEVLVVGGGPAGTAAALSVRAGLMPSALPPADLIA